MRRRGSVASGAGAAASRARRARGGCDVTAASYRRRRHRRPRARGMGADTSGERHAAAARSGSGMALPPQVPGVRRSGPRPRHTAGARGCRGMAAGAASLCGAPRGCPRGCQRQPNRATGECVLPAARPSSAHARDDGSLWRSARSQRAPVVRLQAELLAVRSLSVWVRVVCHVSG